MQVLADTLPRSKKSSLDILVETLEGVSQLGVFTVFLSTQSKVDYTQNPPYPPSSHFAQGRRISGSMHAPITETPFDCFGPHELNPYRLKAADVDRVELMACFGRPL